MEQERLYYLRVSLLAYMVWIIVFEAVGFYAAGLPTRDITLPLDRRIPLVSAFIWSYLLCYVFPFLPLLVVRDWHRFNRALLAIILANAAAFAVYILLPIAFPRPELGSSLSDRVLALQFRYDFKPGANKLPSLHVTYAWIVCLLCRRQGLGRVREGLILLTATLISVSTLFVKQHILLDVLAGAAWAVVAWIAAGRLYPRPARHKSVSGFEAPDRKGGAAAPLLHDGADFSGRSSLPENPAVNHPPNPQRPDATLQVRGIGKSFGRRRVLRDVSFRLPRGRIVGITGENGAGKTTLLRIIVGLLAPDSGEVTGEARIGYCPQELAVFETLTVRENFSFFAAAYGLDRRGAEKPWVGVMDELCRRFRFTSYQDALVSTLSGGTKQKLNFALSVLHNPGLLILDEPYSGFDWETYLRFWEYAEERKSMGLSILIVSHFVYDRSKFDLIFELQEGRLRCA